MTDAAPTDKPWTHLSKPTEEAAHFSRVSYTFASFRHLKEVTRGSSAIRPHLTNKPVLLVKRRDLVPRSFC